MTDDERYLQTRDLLHAQEPHTVAIIDGVVFFKVASGSIAAGDRWYAPKSSTKILYSGIELAWATELYDSTSKTLVLL